MWHADIRNWRGVTLFSKRINAFCVDVEGVDSVKVHVSSEWELERNFGEQSIVTVVQKAKVEVGGTPSTREL